MPILYLTPCASFLNRGFRLWRPRRFALGTRPARCRRRILESRERRHAFPSGEGGALIETGMIVQERHTAPVGDRVGFFADAGHSLRLLPPEVTRGTSRC